MKAWLRLYFRSARVAFARSNEPAIGFVWRHALASVVCLGCAVLVLTNVIVGGDPPFPALLASIALLVLAASDGAYVVYRVKKAGLLASGAKFDSGIKPRE